MTSGQGETSPGEVTIPISTDSSVTWISNRNYFQMLVDA